MRDVVGWEGLYGITSCGKVWSYRRKRFIHTYGGDDYQMVGLYKDGKTYFDYVHRLVAKAYLPNPHNYPEVNHIDEVKNHNWVNNLEWCSRKQNMNYGSRLEKQIATCLERKAFCYGHSPKKVYCTETDTTYPSIRAAAAALGLAQPMVSNCVNGKFSNVKGYHFRIVT